MAKQNSKRGGRKPQCDAYGLTAKEREFADLYRGGPDDVRGVAWRCYKEVWPRAAKRTAEVEGAKLIKKPEIAAYLEKQTEKVADEADVTQERVLRELGRIVFGDPRKLFAKDGTVLAVHEWPDEVAAVVASIEVTEEFAGRGSEREFVGYTKKVRFWDKNSAIEKLMKHLGMFEKDNKQKADPLVELLSRVSGNGLKPVDE